MMKTKTLSLTRGARFNSQQFTGLKGLVHLILLSNGYFLIKYTNCEKVINVRNSVVTKCASGFLVFST